MKIHLQQKLARHPSLRRLVRLDVEHFLRGWMRREEEGRREREEEEGMMGKVRREM